MSTYPNKPVVNRCESLRAVAGAFALALLAACGSNDSGYNDYDLNADADAANAAAEDALMNAANAAEIDMSEDLLANAESPPEPTCAAMPANGALLVDRRKRASRGHTLEIDNGTEGDAIIKVRNADTGKTLASFFVERGSKASLQRIPDGNYKFQYMIGDKLGEDCRKFLGAVSANEFPGPEMLMTEYVGDRIRLNRLTYTLYAVPGGNTTPQYLSAADFEKP